MDAAEGSGTTTSVGLGSSSSSTTGPADGGTSSGGSASSSSGGLAEGESCELHEPDRCGAGLKCMPAATEFGTWWDEAACFPIDPDPVGLYEPCIWYERPWSGYDNCGDHAFCKDWDWDGVGVCTGLCIHHDDGTEPECEDPAATPGASCQECFFYCEPSCNPLDTTSCEDEQLCVPEGYPPFACLPDAGDGSGAHGDPCEFLNVCDPGLVCIVAEQVAGCPLTLLGCCSTVCDVDAPNTCPGAAQGEECLEWFGEGEAPPGLESVGVCGLP